MSKDRKALEALIADIDSIQEDLADPMGHSHEQGESLDCLACIVLTRLSNAVAFAREGLEPAKPADDRRRHGE